MFCQSKKNICEPIYGIGHLKKKEMSKTEHHWNIFIKLF